MQTVLKYNEYLNNLSVIMNDSAFKTTHLYENLV